MTNETILYPCVSQYKKLRKLKGLSKEEISNTAGVSIASLNSYESGRRVPNLATMVKLAVAVGGTGLSIDGWK